jgi:hypothetical protein
MGAQSDSPRHSDPEVEALLAFTPVERRCVRLDGWLPDKQRDFVRALTVLGNAEQAAIAVDGRMSGAYKLRTAAGGEEFAAAWDNALALHHRRYPRPEPKGRPSRGEIASGTGRTPWPANDTGPFVRTFESPEAEMRAKGELFQRLMTKLLAQGRAGARGAPRGAHRRRRFLRPPAHLYRNRARAGRPCP